MSGEHTKKEMETGEKPTTSHGKASSEESRKKGKGRRRKPKLMISASTTPPHAPHKVTNKPLFQIREDALERVINVMRRDMRLSHVPT